MIVARVPKNEIEIAAVLASMGIFANKEFYFICGMWAGCVCVGGALLRNSDVGYVQWAFNVNGAFSFGKALCGLMNMLLSIHPTINARVELTNTKSLKMCAEMGWRNTHIANGNQHMVFTRECWRYQKRWPL